MKKRSVFLYWALLLIPTVLIGAAGIRLLSSERERWDQMERSSAVERARSIVQTIRVTVEGVEQGITDGLIAIPSEALLETLLMWEKDNSGIRNVFIWRPKTGLQYPKRGAPASSEQMRFMVRYQTLFVDRTSWLSDDSNVLTGSSRSAKTESRSAKTDKNVGKTASPLEQIYNSQMQQQSAASFPQRQLFQKRQPEQQVKHGWIPWFTDNKFHLLGWVQRGPPDIVFGVELEVVTLVSQLIDRFPRDKIEGTTYALIDDAGKVVHQLGDSPVQSHKTPVHEISLAPDLPHWRVAVFIDPRGANLRSGNAFFILAGLLLATLIVAILLGGALLTRQAYSHWHDAVQKSSFVSNVSHELKTPLTTIRMYAELLLDGVVKGPEKRSHYLHVIVSEAERLTRLVNNVLGFSRLEQGRMNYHIQELDAVDLVHSFFDTNAIRVKESGMSLAMNLPHAPLFIRADADALEHTFLNILDNAVKYASGGGSLEVLISTNDSMCEIRFLDRGPGIPVSHRSKIFEKFQRVDDSLTAAKAGTGLGLAISRHMMKDQGGNLMYEPRDGGGSSFVVSVPLATSRNAA